MLDSLYHMIINNEKENDTENQHFTTSFG